MIHLVSIPMFTFTEFFTNATNSLTRIGGLFVAFLGLVMVVIAAWQIGKGLMGGGKGQTNWALTIVLLIVGGVFMAGGLVTLSKLAAGLGEATKGLGEGQEIQQILPFFWRK